jgi:micrococcal nuclease
MSRRKLTTKRLILAAIPIGIALFGYAQQQGWLGSADNAATSVQPGLYSVARFVDGDTVVVNMGGKQESIRMIGVDTPETHKPNSPVQCYGPAAAAYTKNLIGNNKVRLQADSKSTNRDRYDRLLRYVYLPDGRMVEEELIKNGYGFAYLDFPFDKSGAFAKDQESARGATKGLWQNCKPYRLDSGRWQTNNAQGQ